MSFRIPFKPHTTAALACALLAAPVAAQTADEPPFSLELNSAAQTDAGSCRLTYVAVNGTKTPLGQTDFEVAVFDAEGVVSQFLVLKFGPLVAGKTKVLQFDFDQTPCDQISRIVVNNAPACTLAETGEQSDICLKGLETSSRTAIQFGL
mgnify:CR=1 FL=1|tara:strand:- start:905 stop:1354 length:450 start_codon:yes stop_codon:yes gene_type:complete